MRDREEAAALFIVLARPEAEKDDEMRHGMGAVGHFTPHHSLAQQFYLQLREVSSYFYGSTVCKYLEEISF
jgi:hypothetical protein